LGDKKELSATPASGAVRLPFFIDHSPKVTAKALESLYRNSEEGRKQGGWFPLGAAAQFHSGTDLLVAREEPIFCIAPGEVVAARIGVGPGEHPWGDTGFVLLRHPLEGEKSVYSLFVHLQREPLHPDRAAPWLRALLLDATSAAGKSKWRVTADAPAWKDEDKGKFSRANVQKDKRLPAGIYVEEDRSRGKSGGLYVKLKGQWVKATADGKVQVKMLSPWVDFDLEAAAKRSQIIAALKDGKVAVLDADKKDGKRRWTVEAAERIGMAGLYRGMPVVHWSVFSKDAVFPTGALPEKEFLAKDEVKLKELDLNEGRGDIEHTKKLIEALDPHKRTKIGSMPNHIPAPREVQDYYGTPKESWRSRYLAVKGLTEFALDVDKFLQEERYKSHSDKEREQFKKNTQAFLFWKDLAKADEFPHDGKAIFVHPATALRLMRPPASKPAPIWDEIKKHQKEMWRRIDVYKKWSRGEDEKDREDHLKYFLAQWVDAVVEPNRHHWNETGYIELEIFEKSTGEFGGQGIGGGALRPAGPLNAFLNRYEGTQFELLEPIEREAEAITAILDTQHLVDVVRREGVDGAVRWGHSIIELGRTQTGREYFEKQLREKNSIWQLISKKENHKWWIDETVEKAGKAGETVEDILEGTFFETLAEFMGAYINHEADHLNARALVKMFEGFKGPGSGATMVGLVLDAGDPRKRIVVSSTLTEQQLDIEVERLEEKAEPWERAHIKFANAVKVITAFNAGAALYKFARNRSIRNGAGLAGATANVLMSLKVPELVVGWARSGRLSQAEIAEEVSRVALLREGPGVNSIGRSLAIGSKFTKVLGIVSGLADAIGAGYELAEARKEDASTREQTVHTGYMVGGAYLAIGSGLALIPGAQVLAAAFLIVGTIFELVSTIRKLFLPHHATELEKFIDRCEFGAGRTLEGKKRPELKEQLEELNKFIYDVELREATVQQSQMTVTIGLSGFRSTAKIEVVHIKVTGINDDTLKDVWHKNLFSEMKELTFHTPKDDKSFVTSIDVRIPWDFDPIDDDYRVRKGDDVTVQLWIVGDPVGDGSYSLRRGPPVDELEKKITLE